MITTAAQNQQASTVFADITSRINKNNCKSDFADVAAAASTTPAKTKDSSVSYAKTMSEWGEKGVSSPESGFSSLQSATTADKHNGKSFEKNLHLASSILNTSNDFSFSMKPFTQICREYESQDTFSYSTASREYTILDKYTIPSCMGSNLKCVLYDETFRQKQQSHPDEYKKLLEKETERCQAVCEKYDLDGLSDEEYFYKTRGPMSKEMTDYFYSGFDAEGKRLIAFFCPRVAEHYGWDTVA